MKTSAVPKLSKRWMNLTAEQRDAVIAVLLLERERVEQPRTGRAYQAGEAFTAAMACLVTAPLGELGPETVDLRERARALVLLAVATGLEIPTLGHPNPCPELGVLTRTEVQRHADELLTYAEAALRRAMPALDDTLDLEPEALR